MRGADAEKIKRYNLCMPEQVINKRMRQVFERLLLECLTSFQRQQTAERLGAYAGCLVRWSTVVPMAAHAQNSCALVADYLTALAAAAAPLDRRAHECLRQLGKCLVLWGRSAVDAVEHSEVERDLAETLTAWRSSQPRRTDTAQDPERAEFGAMVSYMLSTFKTWSLQPESSSLQLSEALIALKSLAERHQDQRIMELSWATANMLDRVVDGTLRLTAEFHDVVQRAAKLLVIAFVFQAWSLEDELEFAKTIEDADILASGGDVSSLST